MPDIKNPVAGKATMAKKVKIVARIPIRTVNPPIHGTITTSMTTSDILKCILARATVYEYLSDGSLLKLDMKNYATENKPAPKVVKKPEKKTLESSVNKSAVDPAKAAKNTAIIQRGSRKLTDQLKEYVDGKFIPGQPAAQPEPNPDLFTPISQLPGVNEETKKIIEQSQKKAEEMAPAHDEDAKDQGDPLPASAETTKAITETIPDALRAIDESLKQEEKPAEHYDDPELEKLAREIEDLEKKEAAEKAASETNGAEEA